MCSNVTLMCAMNSTKSYTLTPRSIADTIERYGRLLTVKELAPLLGESPKTLYARVKRGGQPAVLLGGAVKFDPYVTAEWLRLQAA
jgi:hypothetical protein